jgi:hypothetical protein
VGLTSSKPMVLREIKSDTGQTRYDVRPILSGPIQVVRVVATHSDRAGSANVSLFIE